jgi:hypothetical protein
MPITLPHCGRAAEGFHLAGITPGLYKLPRFAQTVLGTVVARSGWRGQDERG